MDTFKQQVIICSGCPLSKTRNHVVYGEGNMKGGIFIIAEAPGKEEDRLGRPFVGLSGQLMDKILYACGFTRKEHVFISNIVKCRPPGNRTPTPEEVNSCIHWLYDQIEMANPKIQVLLGATALKYLAGPEYKITRDHGKWLNCNGRLTMAVYHPSALLRNPALKRETWEDYKKIVFKYRELFNVQHYSPYV
ncbi:MAG: uracil-DNA glycosylase [Bacteroidales bacterium]|jgi:DNA polymerase|nr:uracil-DNA glycosylase [Bacteroidales bacterium]MDD4827146.1 uracil-DNA glycosylase [Bacteroidales bacterium]